MTDNETQSHDEHGQFTTTHGGAGLMRRVQDGKPWPVEAVQELAAAQQELSTPTGRRSIKHASLAQILVIVNHYFDGWQAARARGDGRAEGAALKSYGWLVGHLLRGLQDLDKTDKAPPIGAADVLDAIRSGDGGPGLGDVLDAAKGKESNGH